MTDRPTSFRVRRDDNLDSLKIHDRCVAPSIDLNIASTTRKPVLPSGSLGTTVLGSGSLAAPEKDLAYSDGKNWIVLQSTSTAGAYSVGTPTGPGSGNPSWSVFGVVQAVGKVGHLSMRASSQAPFLAQNPWVATLPVGFFPSQDLNGIPIVTTYPVGTQSVQTGTVDIKTTGNIENISITLDANNGEFFDLNVIIPLM